MSKAMANLSKTITEHWLYSLKSITTPLPNTNSSPNYWSPNASTLITTSQPLSFTLGTGSQILASTLQKCLSTTNHEILIVTCFWAASSSQEAISSLLLDLSSQGLSQGRRIQVRLCFSSRSIVQKLFQTSSLNGRIYPSSEWIGLGLPAPEKLGGLEMEVKSVFVRPFSVMHPKFILVDRKLAFMPSCNVSWENWFEGCIEMRGGIAEKLFDFWVEFWAQGKSNLPTLLPQENEDASHSSQEPHPTLLTSTPPTSPIKQTLFAPSLPPALSILLPSPHNRSPRFRILSPSPCPPTPLNLFLLQLFTQAASSIFIQTPNLNCLPVISALQSALSRGVDIHLVTSSRLMIIEQLVTAGTITEFEVWRLRRWYGRLKGRDGRARLADVERGSGELGELRIGYFHPRERGGEEEPVKTHLKLVLVDGEVTVLGSGNMDRASWYTSQELGVAFFSKEVAGQIRRDVDEALEGRVDYIC